ncbi:hypothetical protein BC936DRAFT_139991 [Jimgerdemannia flammicorona]|uniref:Adhesin domain-containing protein n=1 Tax=Jimgerdemannia flammicorona TaxID=994334 RepID=A0A433B787_9FUNG|nr:hypothetical protein BC936DRAFT_139991 [Jimgerdemannia flammicorona]
MTGVVKKQPSGGIEDEYIQERDRIKNSQTHYGSTSPSTPLMQGEQGEQGEQDEPDEPDEQGKRGLLNQIWAHVITFRLVYAIVFILLTILGGRVLYFSEGTGQDEPPFEWYECDLAQGTLWEGSQNITMRALNYTGMNIDLMGSISSGHISILRTSNPSVTFPTIQVAVYYSRNILPSGIHNIINNDSGTYHHTLLTPKHLQLSQRLTVCWTVVLPYVWVSARKLGIDVQNSRVDIAQEVEGLSFQEAWISTTNAEIEVLGLTAASVRLESENGQIQGHIVANHELMMQTYNSSVNLTSLDPATEKIVVRSTNGTILGKYLAKNVMVETVRGQVSIQAEGEEVTVSNTDGPIGGSYQVAKALTLKTTNGLVDVDAKAEDVEVRTTNGGIFGSYNVSKALKLETTNGLVNVAAEAGEVEILTTNWAIYGSYRALKTLKLVTTNALVEVEAEAEEVDVQTMNGGIFGSYRAAKTVKLVTMNGPVNVKAAGGEVDVQTTNWVIYGSYNASGAVKLATTNSWVNVEAEAGEVEVRTNGSIYGSYIAAKTLKLETVNAPVNVKAKGWDVEVRTTNWSISGSYHATGTLKLSTTDALVWVTANAAEAKVQTTNGGIYGDYAIGNFLAMETSLGQIQANVTFLQMSRFPVVNASTTYGDLKLSLPTNFSGHFDVATMPESDHFLANVHNCLSVTDKCSQNDIVFETNTYTTKIGRKGIYYPGGQAIVRTTGGSIFIDTNKTIRKPRPSLRRVNPTARH